MPPDASDLAPESSSDTTDAPAAAPALKPFEAWALEKKTPAWLLNGARCANAWAKGRELDEATYDAAIVAAGDAKMLPSEPPAKV